MEMGKTVFCRPTEDVDVLTAKQVKELQKRNVQLKEENFILKKRLSYLRHTHPTSVKTTPFPLKANGVV